MGLEDASLMKHAQGAQGGGCRTCPRGALLRVLNAFITNHDVACSSSRPCGRERMVHKSVLTGITPTSLLLCVAHTPHSCAGSNQAIRWLVFTKAKEYFAGPGGDVNKLSVMHTIAASVMAGAASVYG